MKGKGPSRGRYNQVANYVLAQREINIGVGSKPPRQYFRELVRQCDSGKAKYGGIVAAKIRKYFAKL